MTKLFLKNHEKKGSLSMEYIIVFIILLALLITLLIYSGILRGQASELFQKVLNFILIK